jgi:tetratricopeptide (TPR) repeat protein
VLFWWERDAAGAEQSFRRALELNPRHATAHHWFGNVLLSLGRGEEGLDHLGAAHDADTLSLIIGAERGAALYHLRRYGEAEAVLRSTLELGPGFGEARYWLTRTLLAQGDARAALEEARSAARLFENPAALRAEIGIALERGGRREGALEQVRRLDALRGEWPVAHDLALLYAELGLHEQACEELERALVERSTDLAFMGSDPLFEPLAGDPCFGVVQERLRTPRSEATD